MIVFFLILNYYIKAKEVKEKKFKMKINFYQKLQIIILMEVDADKFVTIQGGFLAAILIKVVVIATYVIITLYYNIVE